MYETLQTTNLREIAHSWADLGKHFEGRQGYKAFMKWFEHLLEVKLRISLTHTHAITHTFN